MTRGVIIFVDNSDVIYSSVEFNGDMYPDSVIGYGDTIIKNYCLEKNWNYMSFKELIYSFDNKYFKYRETMDIGLIKTIEKNKDCLDLSSYMTDYIYLINSSDNKLFCKNKEKMEAVDSKCLAIFNYDKLDRIIKHTGRERLKISFSEKYIYICKSILDFYFRLHLGQYDAIENEIKWNIDYINLSNTYQFVREHILTAIRSIVFMNSDISKRGMIASLGIYSDKTDDRGKIAYDLLQVIRHKYSWFKHPEGNMTIDFDSPFPASEYKLAKCSCEEVDDEINIIIDISLKQLEILLEAIELYSYLCIMDIKRILKTFSEDEMVSDLSKIIQNLFKKDMQIDLEENEIKNKVCEFRKICLDALVGI